MSEMDKKNKELVMGLAERLQNIRAKRQAMESDKMNALGVGEDVGEDSVYGDRELEGQGPDMRTPDEDIDQGFFDTVRQFSEKQESEQIKETPDEMKDVRAKALQNLVNKYTGR